MNNFINFLAFLSMGFSLKIVRAQNIDCMIGYNHTIFDVQYGEQSKELLSSNGSFISADFVLHDILSEPFIMGSALSIFNENRFININFQAEVFKNSNLQIFAGPLITNSSSWYNNKPGISARTLIHLKKYKFSVNLDLMKFESLSIGASGVIQVDYNLKKQQRIKNIILY